MKVKNKNQIVIVVSIILILSAGFILTIKRNDSKNNKLPKPDSPSTTSTLPTAQEDFTGGNDRPVLENKNSSDQASVSDNSGQNVEQTNKSTWTISKTGEITVYSPSKNETINNGVTVSGESGLKNIQFRVIDNVSGVISEGSLIVVNGKFSGTINYSTVATEGRLDIFASREDGTEYSNIEIPIRFK